MHTNTSESDDSKRLPVIAITMGDPSGIGPEIIVKALTEPSIYESCRPLIVGSQHWMERAVKQFAASNQPETIELTCLSESAASQHVDSEFSPSPRKLVCVDPCDPSVSNAEVGQVSRAGGQAAFDCLMTGARLVRDGVAGSIVTAPLNKSALRLAGHDWPGHTELLADFFDVREFAMMLYLPPKREGHSARHLGPAGLGVIHTTLHVALRDVFAGLSEASVFEKIALANSVFSAFRKGLDLPPCPALAVAALNPHGGEDGLFGDEEARIIRPAVEQALERGWNVQGPLPVDTLMPQAVDGVFDAVVAMYHDQGHIALKLLDMFDAVNITLGLPVVRTSVAHGTAFELAWQGKARHQGMIRAIEAAAWLTKFGPNSFSSHE